MHPDLASRGPLIPHVRANLATMLQAGPWCWPPADDESALERARDAGSLLSPPPQSPGVVPLVSVRESSATLWALFPSWGETSGASATASFVGEARSAWRTARSALTRSLPLLWTSVWDACHREPLARYVTAFLPPDAPASPERVLDGESFGLAFVLSLASTVLGESLPGDFVALAAVDEWGRLAPVGALPRKIRFAGRYAPRVRRILVAAGQEDEARLAAATLDLDVIALPSAEKAIQSLLPDVAPLLARAGSDPLRRARLVRSFFRLSIAERSAALDWTPIAEAARIALDSWPGLLPRERETLSFAGAVARRHQKNAGEMPIPSTEWLADLPPSIRLRVVASIVQHTADTGNPPTATAEALAREHRVDPGNAFDDHLRLQGALGRLLAVTGRPREALDLQIEAAEGWLARNEFAASSYALSAGYLLVAGLEDRSGFERLAALQAEADTLGDLGDDGRLFVAASRGRALVALGAVEDAKSLLQSVWSAPGPEHVRFGAARLLVRLAEDAGASSNIESVLTELQEHVRSASRGARSARRALALVALDRGARTQDAREVEEALAELRAIDPGPVGHLEAAAARMGLALPAFYVQRFYPY
ncbi:MAG: hypothetical protein HY720_03350 [Planctomycetes bacterium]|nr:hypothetical protein [Planctomycetota bacterium]